MSNRSKKNLKPLLIMILVSVGVLSAYYFASSNIATEGATKVTDHRDLKVKKANLTKIAGELDNPWGFAWLPDGDILFTERRGKLKIISHENSKIREISGTPAVFSSGQGGLLDVTIHPNFADNRYIYLSYAHGNEEGNRLRVTRANLAEESLEDSEVIFEVAQTKTAGQHYGSRFQWLDDGTLIFSVGDGGNPPTEYNGKLIREQAQSLAAHLGKIIRINDDGSVPNDNPFFGRPDVKPEIFSYGHRNIQGITYDKSGQRIIASEHGSRGGDELNAIFSGKNYGWPLTTYSTEYDTTGTLISAHQSFAGMEDPIAVWTPSIAPSTVAYYDGDKYQNWKGDVFLAAMVLRSNKTIAAYASRPKGAVIRITSDKKGNVKSQEKIDVGDVRVRDIEQGPDGYLYIITDATSRKKGTGAIWRIDGVEE